MTAKVHHLPAPSDHRDEHDDHEILRLPSFAKRIGVTRETAWKWARYHREKFPKGSLLLDPHGRFAVDWDAYRKGFTIVN
jgi:hypothetical protein